LALYHFWVEPPEDARLFDWPDLSLALRVLYFGFVLRGLHWLVKFVLPLAFLVYVTWILCLLYREGLNPVFLLCSSLFNVAQYRAPSYVCLGGLLVCWPVNRDFVLLENCLPMPDYIYFVFNFYVLSH
jgi:hypothetical protein